MNSAINRHLTAGTLIPAGMTFNIRVIPDLFTGEMLNVGVAVITNNGKRMVRVINEPGRLVALYGEDSAKTIVFLAKLAEQAVERSAAAPSPNLLFSDPQPFFNMEAEAALSQFFRDQVTVAIPMRLDVKRTEPLKTEKLRAQVYQLLRGKSRFMESDGIIPQSPQAVIQTDKGTRSVGIPLQPINGAGGLESADYSGQTVRLHLMDALLDIEYAAESRKLTKLGLFIARPTGMAPNKQIEIDNAIDSVTWRAPQNCRVEVESDIEKLAEQILDWAEQKAA